MTQKETSENGAVTKPRKRLALKDARREQRPERASDVLDGAAQRRLARLANLLRGDHEPRKQP